MESGKINLMRKMIFLSFIMHIALIFMIFRLANITFKFKDRIPEKDVNIVNLVEKTPPPKIIKEQSTPQGKAPSPTPAPTPKEEKTPVPTPEEKKAPSPKPIATPKMQIQKKNAVKTAKPVEVTPRPQPKTVASPAPQITPRPVFTPAKTENPTLSMEVESFPFDYYKELVRNRILENYSVPSIVAQKNLQCLFRLVVGKNGEILESSLLKSSGDPMLDQAALRAIQFATFPPLPASFKRNSISFVLTFIPQIE